MRSFVCCDQRRQTAYMNRKRRAVQTSVIVMKARRMLKSMTEGGQSYAGWCFYM